MTNLRFLQLKALVDECNEKVRCSASIQHDAFEDRIFIAMFWSYEYHSFVARNKNLISNYNSTNDDDDMTQAEAFMRMLIKSAESNEEMRRT